MQLFPFNLIERYYHQKVDAAGLGIFRIAYGAVILSQALLLSQFRYLIFDDALGPRILIYAWCAVAAGLLAGFQTRVCAVLNYVLSVILVINLRTYTYDFDKIMVSMNFLLMFIPAGKAFSIDALLKRGRADEERTSILSYFIPVLLCLGLPYLDSGLHKILSLNWMKGIGVWAPLSKTQMTWLPGYGYSVLLDNEMLINGMNYLVMLFELWFVSLIWFKKVREIFILIGVGMHLGIFLMFPIPRFALGCAVFYLLLLPPDFFRRKRAKVGVFVGPFKAALPSDQTRMKVLGIGIFLILCCVVQAEYVVNYLRGKQYVMNRSRYETVQPGQHRPSSMEELNDRFLVAVTKTLGIGDHRVFLDHHINTNRTILAIVHKKEGTEEWLPLITPEGHPGRYLQDRVWSRWTGYIMGTSLYPKSRMKETAQMIQFWCREKNISCTEGEFVLKQKDSVTAANWQKDILSVQASQPWKDVGVVTMTDEQVDFKFFR